MGQQPRHVFSGWTPSSNSYPKVVVFSYLTIMPVTVPKKSSTSSGSWILPPYTCLQQLASSTASKFTGVGSKGSGGRRFLIPSWWWISNLRKFISKMLSNRHNNMFPQWSKDHSSSCRSTLLSSVKIYLVVRKIRVDSKTVLVIVLALWIPSLCLMKVIIILRKFKID